jgi:hypothetical protein
VAEPQHGDVAVRGGGHGVNPEEYRDVLAGEDVYVLGSGPSLNHIPASFFAGKHIVTANHGAMSVVDPWDVDFMVTKYHAHAYEYAEQFPDMPIVVTRYNTGNYNDPRLEDDDRLIIVEHPHNTCGDWTAEQWPADGEFIATWSTITTAMHWAAHIGAANIIMAGHDCGYLDADGRVGGYGSDHDHEWWPGFDAQSRVVKEELSRRYGCSIVSINPFINMNLEGHSWRSFAGTVN